MKRSLGKVVLIHIKDKDEDEGAIPHPPFLQLKNKGIAKRNSLNDSKEEGEIRLTAANG